MSHEINIFKETGSGQVTQWPEPSPEESLLAMTSQECTVGGSPSLQGCLVVNGKSCSSSSLPHSPKVTYHHHSLPLSCGKQRYMEGSRIQDSSRPAYHAILKVTGLCVDGKVGHPASLFLPVRASTLYSAQVPYSQSLPFQVSYSLIFYPI